MWRGGGVAPGFLPDAGGAADQAAWLLAAFDELERQARSMEKEA